MVRERVLEDEAISDTEQIEDYVRLTGKLMGYVYREVVDKAMKLAPIRGKVLDVGTGFGMLAVALAQKNRDVEIVGLDISRQMIETGSAIIKKKGLTDRISFTHGDAKEMPFPDNHFDAAISYGSLHHWSDPVTVFNEINRVRKKDGIIYIADLKRDLPRISLWFLYAVIRIRANRRMAGEMHDSVNAAYTSSEIEKILGKSTIMNWQPKHTFYGINVFSRGK